MKNKLLLFLLLHLLLGIKSTAKNIDVNTNKIVRSHSVSKSMKVVKPEKQKIKLSKFKKSVAVLSPPSVVAGSSCGPGIVALSATGASGETIEWFTSQTAAVPIFIGNNYNPNLTTTTTFYVQSRLGADTSIRVPVVGSVYSAPPPVTLSASPANNVVSPLCLGTSVTFTASGGADLFEFSVNGVVTQTMSSVRTYTTNSLTNGQTVSVRSRYAVNLDGSITETAWGTGALEDNILSAALSGNATTGYINSLKISPAEDKIVIGMSGKVLNFRRIMVFLDTKPGGYNISNYGDENGSLPPVRAFNFFNNNPSTFDSYFAADYCVAIATDAGETNYYADVIELRNPNSLKTYLGTAATGVPTSVMGINKNNTGTSDYNLGFEVEVSKALIGYTTGDVKFFALTMQDNDVSNYNVTNSFLSPERTSTSDYGNGAINYNLRDPNPIVVAEAAFTPCYSEDSLVMNFVANPTVAAVGANQTRCVLTSNPLGGNTPTIGTGLWTLKSGPGTVSFGDNSIGNTTATVSVKGTYVFTWTISSGQCTQSFKDISVVFNITNPPTGSVTQSFCEIDNKRVSDLFAIGNNVEWFLNPTGGSALSTNTNLVTGNYYTEQTDATTLCKSITRLEVAVVIEKPAAPSGSGIQTVCNSGTIANLTATGTNIKWYVNPTGGTALSTSLGLVTGTTYYASQTIGSCESSTRYPLTVTIINPQNPISGGIQSVCSTSPLQTLTAIASVTTGTIVWYDALINGNLVASPILNSVGSRIYYAQNTIGVCNSTTRTAVSLEIKDSPFLNVTTKSCSLDLLTYSVNFNVASGSTITRSPLVGSIVGNTIIGIPAGTAIDITANKGNGCLEVVNVVAPNCSCSLVNNPVNGGDESVCQGQPNPALTATVNAGETIDWYSASSSGSLLLSNSISFTPLNTLPGVYTYYAQARKIVDGCLSSSRTAVSLTITAQVAPTGALTQTFCESQNAIVADLVVTGTSIKWYPTISSTLVLLSSASLVDGEDYFATQTTTSGLLCESVNRLKVTVSISKPLAPIGSLTQSFCESENVTVADLVATGTSIKWYPTLTSTVALSSSALLVDGEDYFATQTTTSGLLCESVNRLKVTVSISKPAAPSGLASQTFCESQNATIAILVATGTNIKWYSTATSTTALSSSLALANGDYFATQTTASGLSCESVNRLKVTVTINKPSAPSGSGAQTVCNSGTISNLIATGTVNKWYANSTGGTALSTSTVLVTGTTYYATQTVGICESVTRYPLVVTIINPEIPISGGNQSVCATSPLQTLTATANVTTGTIEWYDALTNGNIITSPVLNSVGSDTYYAQNNISTCVSTSRIGVTLEIKDSPFLSVTTKTCSLDLLTYSISFNVASGSTITRSPSVGSISGNSITGIPAGTPIAITANKGNGCIEVVNVSAPNCSCSVVNNPIFGGNKSVCEGQVNPFLTVTVNAGEVVDWFSATSGGSPLVTNSLTYTPLNTVPGVYTYFAEARKTIDGCISSSRTAVSVTITSQATPTGSSTQSYCESENATVADLAATGTSIKWYPTLSSTVALSSSALFVDGEDYFATQTATSGLLCESVNRLKVTVSISKPAAPTGSAAQTFCESQNATIESLSATGTNIKWYSTATSTTALLSSLVLANGDYFATQTITTGLSCESVNRLKVTVTINKPAAPSGSGAQTVCNSGTISNLTATGTSIKWYANATEGSALSTSTVLVTGTTYYATQTVGICESVTRYPLVVTIINPQIPISGGNQSVCATSSLQTLTAAVSVVTGTIEWYDALTNGNLIASPVLNTVGSVQYYAQNKIGSCFSTSRTAVTLEIKDSPFLNVTNKSCSLDLLTYSVNFTVASGSTITRSPEVGSIVGNSITGVPAGTTIDITANKGNGCVEVVNVVAPNCSCSIINNPISGGNKSVCEGQVNPSLSVTVNTGEVVDWYIAISGGSPLVRNSLMYTPLNTIPGVYTYFAEAKKTIDGCISSSRTTVSLTIIDQGAPTGSPNQSFCESQNATIADLVVAGTTIKWYASTTSTVVLSPTQPLVDGDYFATQTATTGLLCESVNRLKVTVKIDRPLPPVLGIVTQPTCAKTTGSVLLTGLPTVGSWTIIPSIGSSVTGSGSSFEFINLLASNSFTFKITNGAGCTSALSTPSITINAVPTAPNIPIALTVVQPTCAVQSGSITIATQSGVEYSINGTSFQSNPIFSGLAPNTYTLYIRNLGDITCISSSVTDSTISALPTAPAIPTITSVIQPTCSIPSGTILVASQNGVEYSIGNGFQNSPEFENLVPGKYAISVRFFNNTSCLASGANQVTINSIPESIQFAITGDCENKKYELTANPINNTNFPNDVFFEWKDSNSSPIGSDSNVLNVSDILASTLEKEEFPLEYNLTISSSSTGCETTNKITVASVFCDIQKGISPDGNGSNDNFDLSFRKVKKLEIFNRYGLKLYSKMNYTNQWEGQTDNGDILPSATYYYVIEFNTGEEPITGWIYLIRNNDK